MFDLLFALLTRCITRSEFKKSVRLKLRIHGIPL